MYPVPQRPVPVITNRMAGEATRSANYQLPGGIPMPSPLPTDEYVVDLYNHYLSRGAPLRSTGSRRSKTSVPGRYI